MPTIGDVLRFTSLKEYADQTLVNVYFHTVIGQSVINIGLDSLTQAFYEGERNSLASFTSVWLFSHKVVLDNLSNPTERYEYTPVREAIGTVTGDPLPAHDSIGIRLNRTTLDTRNGSKRYSGLPESIVSSGLIEDTAAIHDAMDDFLSEDLVAIDTFLAAITLRPVIVKRLPNGDYDLGTLNPVSGIRVSQYMTTQTSRKQGR